VFRTLQARLTAGFVTVIAATALAVSLSVLALYVASLETQYKAAYASKANAVWVSIDDRLRIALVNDLTAGNARSAISRDQLRTFVSNLSNESLCRIRVYTILDKGLVIDSGEPTVPRAAHVALDTFGPVTHRSDIQLTYSGSRLSASLATIVVSQPLTDRAYQQHLFFQRVGIVTCGALLLAFVLGGVLAERLTAPFRLLTGAAARVGEGNLKERVPEDNARVGRRDEAGELAYQFNRMAVRLEESFALVSTERDRAASDRDHLRQFVADVSHELRTPLTALHTFNDVLRDGAGEAAVTRHEFLDASAQQIERLEWLTRNLLDLSRLETGIARIDAYVADLAETLRNAVAANRPGAVTKGIVIELDASPSIVVHDPPRVEQALSNILSNAVKFSPQGGQLSIRLYVTETSYTVEVRDEGPGISQDEVMHIFERFYRGRDANRSGEGSGLGLSIAKAIVEAHAGTIVVDSMSVRGTTIRLMLPMSIDHRPPTG